MSELLDLELDLLEAAIKHGKHNQASHGRKTARRRAYSAAYSQARAGGASVQDARATAREAGIARQSERDARLKQIVGGLDPGQRWLYETEKGARSERIRAERIQRENTEKLKKLDTESFSTNERQRIQDLDNSLTSDQLQQMRSSTTQARDAALRQQGGAEQALAHQRTLRMLDEVEKIKSDRKRDFDARVEVAARLRTSGSEAARLQAKVDRGRKLTKTEQGRLAELRKSIIDDAKNVYAQNVQQLTDDQIYQQTIAFYNRNR